jgi:integrase
MIPQKLPRGIFRRDNAYWIRYADRAGRMHREKVGPFLKKAMAAYNKRKSEIYEGKFFSPGERKRPIVFSEISKEFLDYSKRNKRSHGHDSGRMVLLLRLWRDCLITELNAGRIERDLGLAAIDEQWLPATYNRYRALASATFALAIRNGKAASNPVRGVGHRIENNARVRFLSEEEEWRLFGYFDRNFPERMAEVIVALHSGMRRSEQYLTSECPEGGLKWGNVDFRNGLLTIPRSKHGGIRHIPMNSVLRSTLADLRKSATSDYVFPGGIPSRWFTCACEEVEIRNFTWHSLRHTFASRLVMGGVDLRTVQELMGHRTITTTMRYAHLAPAHQAEAVERLVVSQLAPLLAPKQGSGLGAATA